jgi:putative DNA primase/helicase
MSYEDVNKFRDAMADDGFFPGDIEPDGKIHRFSVNGRRDRSAWYCLYSEPWAGAYGDWRADSKITWSAVSRSTMSDVEQKAFRDRMEKAKEERERLRKEAQAKAAKKAKSIWDKAIPATAENAYLKGKGLKPYGDIKQYGKALVVPVRGLDGQLHSLQFIGPDGGKRFLTDGRIQGGCSWIKGDGGTLVTEGWATAASLCMATGCNVVSCFNAGNMGPVVDALLKSKPGIEVVVCADNDQWLDANVGIEKARAVAKKHGLKMAVPTFKDLSTKPTDFDDLRRLEGIEEVKMQVEAAESLQEKRTGLDACVVGFAELLQMDIPERAKMFPWLPEGGVIMVYGGRGIGKTFFTLSLAGSLTSGAPFLKWGEPSKTVGVLIVDGEMALSDLRSRLTALLIKQPIQPLRIISSEVAFAKTERDINLVDGDQRDDILSILDANKEIRLVIIDNISCLFSGIRESSKDDWEQVTPWLLAMRRRGVAVVLVHHAGKGGDQRGTSGREDLLDTVIRLERVHGASNDGARFIVRFTKSRGAYGDEVEPFEASLDLGADELWTWRKLEESNYERMIALARDGVSTVTDMAEELGITKGTVSKLKKKGIDAGDLAKGSTIKLVDEEN